MQIYTENIFTGLTQFSVHRKIVLLCCKTTLNPFDETTDSDNTWSVNLLVPKPLSETWGHPEDTKLIGNKYG